MHRKRSTAKQTRESVRRAKRACHSDSFRYREGMMGFRNSAEGVGDGGEDVGPTTQDGYTTTSADARKTRDHEPWADGTEAEGGEGFKMDEAVKRAGFKLAFKNRGGGRTYENEAV